MLCEVGKARQDHAQDEHSPGSVAAEALFLPTVCIREDLWLVALIPLDS
jgi:hypothetical protein